MSIGDILQPEPAKRMDCFGQVGSGSCDWIEGGTRGRVFGGGGVGGGDGRSYSSTGAKWGFF